MSHVLILVEVDSAIKEKKKKNSDVETTCYLPLMMEIALDSYGWRNAHMHIQSPNW